jgi:hypothetical protein
MPWLPITAQPHETSPVDKDVPAAEDLSTWVWDQYRLESDLSGQLGFSIGTLEASRDTRTLIACFRAVKR